MHISSSKQFVPCFPRAFFSYETPQEYAQCVMRVPGPFNCPPQHHRWRPKVDEGSWISSPSSLSTNIRSGFCLFLVVLLLHFAKSFSRLRLLRALDFLFAGESLLEASARTLGLPNLTRFSWLERESVIEELLNCRVDSNLPR